MAEEHTKHGPVENYIKKKKKQKQTQSNNNNKKAPTGHGGVSESTSTKQGLSLPLAPPFHPVQVTMTMKKAGMMAYKQQRVPDCHKPSKQASTGSRNCAGIPSGTARPRSRKQVTRESNSLSGVCPLISPTIGQCVSIYSQVLYGHITKIKTITATSRNFKGHMEYCPKNVSINHNLIN